MKDLKEMARECKGFIPDWEWYDADCIEQDILEMLENKDKEGMQAVIELLYSFPLAKPLIQDIKAVLEQEPETYRVGWEDLENEEHIDYWDYKESELELAEAKFDSIELEKGQRKYILHLGKVEMLEEDFK